MSILILDDHPLVRKGIVNILSMNNPEIHIEEADNIEDALKMLSKKSIGIVLVDLFLGKESGFDFIERAKLVYKKTVKFIILTSSSSLHDFKRSKQLEVDGYILKDAFVEEILCAFQVIQRGGKFFSSTISEKAMGGLEPKELSELTKREKEVLVLLRKGYSNAQIATQLYIAEGTTKKHISSILSKLNLSSRIEVMVFAKKIYERW